MKTINNSKFNLSLPLWLHWRVLQALLAYSDPTDRKNHFQITLSASSCKYQEQKQVLIDWVELTPITFLRMGSMKKEPKHCLKSLLFSNDQGLNLILMLCNFCHCTSIQNISEPFQLFWWFQKMFIIETRQSQQMSIFFSILFGSESIWLKTYFFNSISSVFWIEICQSGTEVHLIKIIDVFWRSKLFKIKFIDHLDHTQVRS